ncbi:MAG: hypothetical protein ACREJO_16875 [Phycisphaerales bacterium]
MATSTRLITRQSRPRRRWGLWAVLAVATFVAAFVAIWAILPATRPRVRWNPQMSSKPIPELACLLFPSTDAEPVIGGHDGEPLGVMDEAVAIPFWDFTQAIKPGAATTGLLHYKARDKDGYVRLDSMRLLPPAGTKVDYVGNYIAHRKAASPKEFIGARFEIVPAADGAHAVTFSVLLDDYHEFHRITVDAHGTGHANEFAVLSGMEAGFQGFGNMVIAAGAAIVLTPVLLLALRFTILQPRLAVATPPRTT